MRILHKDFILLSLLFIPILFLWWRGLRKRKKYKKLFSDEQYKTLVTGKIGYKNIYGWLFIFTITLFALILARFQYGHYAEINKIKARDIAFVVDVSKSMDTNDVSPSRLARVKMEINLLLDNFKGDRVALIIFAGSAFVQLPLTNDYDLVRNFVDNLSTKSIKTQGTNIAQALLLADKVLRISEKERDRSRVVILFSDGENTTGEKPVNVARKLSTDGIVILTVGVGTPSGEPIPIKDKNGNIIGYKKDESGKVVVSKINSKTLRKIAEVTAGDYFQLRDNSVTKDVLKDIKKIDTTIVEKKVEATYEDRYYWFAMPLFLIMLLEGFLRIGRKENEK